MDDYDALILRGGVVNPDTLRQDDGAIRFVRAFFRAGKPVGMICHGPWSLVEAGVACGRPLTSFASIRTDLRGPTVIDQEVVTDRGLVSSRSPNDLAAFCGTIVEELAENAPRAPPGRDRAPVIRTGRCHKGRPRRVRRRQLRQGPPSPRQAPRGRPS